MPYINTYEYNVTYNKEGNNIVLRVSLKQWCIEYILIGNQMLENIQKSKKAQYKNSMGMYIMLSMCHPQRFAEYIIVENPHSLILLPTTGGDRV